MTPFGTRVFFVTFSPRHLSRILAEHEQPGMQLFILERSGSLVELSGQGHRLELKRPEHLSLEEQSRILATQDVPAAEWRVAALPLSTHGPSTTLTVRQESAGLLAGLGIFAFGFHQLLGRERKRRHAAEEHAREMAELGFVDALTGLPNRRALDTDLEREWLNLERSDEPLSLLMIDLDHFKTFNDTYGHLAGDHCLRLVGQAMRSSLKRPRDRIARFGGEEFAILLPNTPCLAARLLADALHETVREAFQADHEDYGVTLSIGITCAHAGKLENAAALLDLADQALYGAKGAGRNTTVVIPAS
jgi:diguanylate cyclase (GGDEF)-like protein